MNVKTNETRTIIAAPLHPVMLTIMEHIVSEAPVFIQRMAEGAKVQDVIMDWTGPSIFSDIILSWTDSHLPQEMKTVDGIHNLQKPTKIYDTLFLPRMAWGVVDAMNGTPETGVLVRHGYAGSWIVHEDEDEDESVGHEDEGALEEKKMEMEKEMEKEKEMDAESGLTETQRLPESGREEFLTTLVNEETLADRQ